jgi:hypothetical protein
LETEIAIRFKYKRTPDESVDDTVSASGLKIAQFLIPRLNNEAIISYATDYELRSTQVLFSHLVSELIFDLTSNKSDSIDPKSIDEIISMLSNFGVVNVTIDGLKNRRIIRTALGRHVVGDEVIDLFEQKEFNDHANKPTEYRSVSTLQVLSDISVLLSRLFAYLIRNLMALVRKAQP